MKYPRPEISVSGFRICEDSFLQELVAWIRAVLDGVVRWGGHSK
jgi:hypothetical protein